MDRWKQTTTLKGISRETVPTPELNLPKEFTEKARIHAVVFSQKTLKSSHVNPRKRAQINFRIKFVTKDLRSVKAGVCFEILF